MLCKTHRSESVIVSLRRFFV